VAGKVTIGLASHWPCVTDFSGLGSTATETEMNSEHPTYTLCTGAWSTLLVL